MTNFFFAFLIWETVNLATNSLASSTHPIIVLIAFDGVLQHYLDQENPPADLQELLKVSTTTEYMLHQLPSQTLPNLHSIATGLHPEMHGVLGEYTFDEQANQCIGYGTQMYQRPHTDVIPIWTLNEMSGDGRYSGVITWPGAEFSYRNESSPTFILHSTECVKWEDRVDYAVSWLRDETKPANLILLHFEASQRRTAKTVPTIVQRVDAILKYYFEQLNHYKLRHKTNTIIMGDHAVPNASVGATPECNAASLTPDSNCQGQILENLRQATASVNAFKALQYAKLKNNFKTGEISQQAERYLDAQLDNIFVHPTKFLDAYGQDTDTPGLFPLFIANGPLFKSDFVAPPFENIDVYALISHTLNLTTPGTPVNGSFQWIQHLLKEENTPVYDQCTLKMILFSTVGLLLVACAWYILRVRRQERIRL